MNKFMANNAGGIFIACLIAIFFGGYVFVLFTWNSDLVDSNRREYVCTYLGGHVEGKVCVKGNNIIETRFK